MNVDEKEIYECKIKELEKENEYYKHEAESFWAEECKRKQVHLELAQHIAERDSKAIANIILNMYFGKIPSDSVSFCEIFNLRGNGRCKEGIKCTDCIDNFLREHYAKI